MLSEDTSPSNYLTLIDKISARNEGCLEAIQNLLQLLQNGLSSEPPFFHAHVAIAKDISTPISILATKEMMLALLKVTEESKDVRVKVSATFISIYHFFF